MEAEHTPGPWSVSGEPTAEIIGGMGLRVAAVSDFRPEWRANAALIAAAPRLLTSLNALVEAVARARKADDNVYRAATDPSEALFDEQEDAHATLIICENEARAAIAQAVPAATAER